MKFHKNKNNKAKKWFAYLILGGFVIKALAFIFKKESREKVRINFKDFFKEEKEEVEELVEGKQGFKKFCCDSGSIIKEYFIPYEDNDHKPKILRTKSLAVIVIGLVLIKAAVTGYLFFIYPNQARMTELISRQILELINKDRFSNNLPTLTINSALNSAALTKAQDMLDYDYFAHKSLNGKMPWDWINRGEYAYLFVGENLAMNFSSAQAAHNALMRSETHKKNILNNKYADIGLAVLSGELDGENTNVLVQMFGYQKPQTIDSRPADAKALAGKQHMAESGALSTAVLPAHSTIPDESVELEPVSEPATANSVEQPAELIKPVLLSQGGPAEPEKEIKIEIKPVKKKETKVAAVSKDIYVSPNKLIENNKITQAMSFTVQEDEKITLAAKLVRISHNIFIVALAIIAVALFINIFVRISIQHKSVIVQSLLVIIFIVSLIYVRLHFLEQVLERVNII